MNPLLFCLRRAFQSRWSGVRGPLLFLVFACACFGQQHSATLTWTDGDPVSFNVYRLTGQCPGTVTIGKFSLLASVAAGQFTYQDLQVVAGGRYCYVVTAVTTVAGATAESGPSNDAGARIPVTPPVQGAPQTAADPPLHGVEAAIPADGAVGP
jgi:hypothetical protein